MLNFFSHNRISLTQFRIQHLIFSFSPGRPRSVPDFLAHFHFFVHFRIPISVFQILTLVSDSFRSIPNLLVQFQISSLSFGFARFILNLSLSTDHLCSHPDCPNSVPNSVLDFFTQFRDAPLSSEMPRSVPDSVSIFLIHFRIPVSMFQILSSVPDSFRSIQNSIQNLRSVPNSLAQFQIDPLSSWFYRLVLNFLAHTLSVKLFSLPIRFSCSVWDCPSRFRNF